MDPISCFYSLCFVPPEATGSTAKLFGFSEFLASLALLVVIFTVSDTRYKFRISIAPIPLYGITFFIISLTGFGSLISDFWIGQNWWVLKTELNIRVIFQAVLGFLFLSCFILWVYFAFINPPRFSKRNSEKYIKSLYLYILKGNNGELAVIADELGYSAYDIVKNAGRKGKLKIINEVANDILLLIANRKFCFVLVNESPRTAVDIFISMTEQGIYDIPINQFSARISEEAILNKESIIYHEEDGYHSGLMGYIQQWSKAVYGDPYLIDSLSKNHLSPLNIDYRVLYKLDADQWNAYGRVISIYFDGLVNGSARSMLSSAFNKALDDFKMCTSELYKIDKLEDDVVESMLLDKARVSIDFLKDIFMILSKANIKINDRCEGFKIKYPMDIYSSLANLMFNIIFDASKLKSPLFVTWHVQNNIVWDGFFNEIESSKHYRITRSILIRLIYNELKEVKDNANFKNIRILGMLLNVLGLKEESIFIKSKDVKFLKRFALKIAKENYLSLIDNRPEVAEHMLGGGIGYDAETLSLVKIYPRGIRKIAPKDILLLNDS